MKKHNLRKIKIFDTTLRDGEQAPGASMKSSEKLSVAKLLQNMKVDIIEAGFPAVSDDDFSAVRKISESIKDTTIAALARSRYSDIDKCVDALVKAKKKKNPKIQNSQKV